MTGYSTSQPANPYMSYWPRYVTLRSNSTALNSIPSSLAVFGLISLALLLLALAALFAGLTLAICSLDMAWLDILSTSGCEKQRHRSLVVARIRCRTSWFLCSTIICSVACTESIPIVLRELGLGQHWQPILVSTLVVALFAELLPQYFIPRHALFWGYYCWPVIWGCMWITCVISWPLSVLLDRYAGSLREKAVFTSEQLATLIQYHERSEKHGGAVGPDAGRIARSAMHLEGQTLRSQRLGSGNIFPDVDIEKGAAKTSDIIVPWSRVRCVDINDEVTKEFIHQIRSWAYSRIPVVGDGNEGKYNSDEQKHSWNGQKLYGFLHVKNILGVDLADRDSQSGKLLVKDLPLYPLPIVRDDLPIYDLLTLFQTGMSRVAVVMQTLSQNSIVISSVSEKIVDTLPCHHVPLWSAKIYPKNGPTVKMCPFDRHIDWTTDFLKAAQNNGELSLPRKQNIVGIGCPEPLGIVTYEDVLETLLQRPTYDEKDFFAKGTPIKKTFEEGDTSSIITAESIVRTRNNIPAHIEPIQAAFERSGVVLGSLRMRNITMPLGYDGVNDNRDYGLGESVGGTAMKDSREFDESSYTDNSRGGFHGDDCILGSLQRAVMESSAQVAFIEKGPLSHPHGSILPPTRTSSSPAKMLAVLSLCQDTQREPASRNFSCSEITSPRLRRVTPFSHLRAVHEKSVSPQLLQVGFSTSIAGSQQQSAVLSAEPDIASRFDDYSEKQSQETGDTISLWSSDNSKAGTLAFEDYQRASRQPDSELVTDTLSGEENIVPERSTSQPHNSATTSEVTIRKACNIKQLHIRVETFYDDRALLPSQRKAQKGFETNRNVKRGTNLKYE